MNEADSSPPRAENRNLVLLVSVFVVATCGIGYELLAGTLSSYLLGNSVTQFSMVIGLFLSSMGAGSWLSRYVERDLLRTFLRVEVLVGILGGVSPLVLFFSFAVLETYLPMLVALIGSIGLLVGLEIPLLTRLLRDSTTLRVALGDALAVDYLGALAASIAFPLLMVPHLGLVRTGALFGMLNLAVALLGLFAFRERLETTRGLALSIGASSLGLLLIFITAAETTRFIEDRIYDDEIIYAESTPYQRIVITRWHDDVRLYLDGNVQFSTVDEFRYHESLVHPAMGAAEGASNILVLGGGDGMAVREILKHPGVERVTLVDLDPTITRLFRDVPQLRALNNDSLHDARVEVVNDDALKFLEASSERYDVVVIDLPDPNDVSLGKLYSRSFYRLLAQHLAPGGVMVTQATSPFYATDAFWCVVNTIEATTLSSAGGAFYALPYHTLVPSFGDWGFVLAAHRPLEPAAIRLDVPTRYLTEALLPTLFVFGADIDRRETPVNRLDTQVLVRLYLDGYRRYSL